MISRRDQNTNFLIILTIAIVTLAVRWFIMTSWVDMPGDGPTRAMYAYNWHKAPYWQTHGIWLPGYMYVSGLFNFIIDDPYISLRVLNLIFGTLSSIVFFLLIKRIFSTAIAVVSVSILAFLPMHVGLSASSMSDISFILEMLIGLLFIIKAAEANQRRHLYLSISLVALILSCMTRYEGWLFIPVYPLYYFLKTKRIGESLVILAALALYPFIWMLGNYLNEGKFLLGLSGVREYSTEVRTGLIKSTRNVARVTLAQIGWIVTLLAAVGIVKEMCDALRLRIKSEVTLYIAITAIIWLFLLYFGYVRGTTMMDRYFFLGIVLIIPFAVVPIEFVFKNQKKFISISIILLLLLFALAKTQSFPLERLTNKKPLRIQKVAEWLKNSEYRNEPVLLTRLWWESTYFPIFFPEIGKHDESYFIYAWCAGMSTERFHLFLRDHRPSIVITCDDDNKLIAETESMIGSVIDGQSLIKSIGEIKIYDITKQINLFLSKDM